MAVKYAEQHALVLDEQSFQDLGVSAFRGKNADSGMLGEFLDCVRRKMVPHGSFLLVESLDRLSRKAARRALRQLEDIIDAGITVVTLVDGRRYASDMLDSDPLVLMQALVIMIRAHEESAMKSGRLRATWENKRNLVSANKLTARAPAWLKLNPDRKSFTVLEDRCKIVQRIFEMSADGKGQAAIAKTLNDEGVQTFGTAKYWQRSYIKKILENPAVIGTLIPHRTRFVEGKRIREPLAPEINYYPRIVSDELFECVRLKNSTHKVAHGPAALNNIFAGLLRCPECNGTMTRVTKGARAKAGKAKFVCSAAKVGATPCKYKSVPQDQVELAFLESIDVFSKDIPQRSHLVESEIESLDTQINALRDSAVEHRAPLANSKEDDIDAADLIREHRSLLRGMTEALEAQRAELEKHRNRSAPSTLLPYIRELKQLCRAQPLDKQKINKRLHRLFMGIVIEHDKGWLAFRWRHGGETIVEYCYPYADDMK